MNNIFIPVWNRSPNKLIRYYERPFELSPNAFGIKHKGIETIVVFKDKHGKEQEMVAYIKWSTKW